jgi:nucleotide-binding universal stress UspA family protein
MYVSVSQSQTRPEGGNRVKQIVVGVDGSEYSLQALAWARELARSSPEKTFHLVHAYQPVIPVTASVHSVGPALDKAKLAAESIMASIAQKIEGLQTKVHVRQGTPARAVLDVAKEVQADLLAVGRRGLTPAASALLGSASSEILHHGKRPVLVVHDAPARTVETVLVGIDDSAHSAKALAFATAWLPNVTVTALHVKPGASDVEADATAHDVAARTAERAGVPLERLKVIGRSGNPVEAVVLEYRSGSYDMAVVGSRGLGTLGELFLGSVSERLSRLAHGAVVVVK